MRRSAAVAAAKVAAGLSRRFRLGGGTALPGLVAERIDPEITGGLASRLGQGSVLVTGTNGKTTTARLLRNIVHAAGMDTVANRAGSNMMRGIASALVESAGWSGGLDGAASKMGVFEVDEATVPEAAWAVRPRAVLFTNLFRDQLDRYGEVEYVADVWRKAVAGWPDVAVLVLNADDPSVASLGKQATGSVIYYGLEDTSAGRDGLDHAADARWCTACGAELAYATVYYGHLGHWRCPGCGNERPKPGVAVAAITPDGDGTMLQLRSSEGELTVRMPLTGTYNAYNVAAATAAAMALGLETTAIETGLASFTAAFGRQERLTVAGRDVQVILAKNPAGLNQVLRTITADEGGERDLVFFLNDDIADGRDISWIWDVDFELLTGKTRAVTASGRRAWDMALRLKYAGLEPALRVEPDSAEALGAALRATPEGAILYVIPTYTAMLEVRDYLVRKAGRGAFWEEAQDG
ncbi:MAG TPA: MurT ligase domain-containing protein [Dehalococcoidia bacterium]|nr:MurT ligase domain-containing protein [Dehalococcoidia bacterium]